MKFGRPSIKSVERQSLNYVQYNLQVKCSRTVGLQYLGCYTIMMHHFRFSNYSIGLHRSNYDNARHCIQYEYRWCECSRARCIPRLAPPGRPSVPPTSGHLSRTDTFAWSRGCPSTTGTTVIGHQHSAHANYELFLPFRYYKFQFMLSKYINFCKVATNKTTATVFLTFSQLKSSN